jgi:hypothetical protein
VTDIDRTPPAPQRVETLPYSHRNKLPADIAELLATPVEQLRFDDRLTLGADALQRDEHDLASHPPHLRAVLGLIEELDMRRLAEIDKLQVMALDLEAADQREGEALDGWRAALDACARLALRNAALEWQLENTVSTAHVDLVAALRDGIAQDSPNPIASSFRRAERSIAAMALPFDLSEDADTTIADVDCFDLHTSAQRPITKPESAQ